MEIPPQLPEHRVIVTRERLRLLSLGYKISGIICVVMASFLIFHFIIFTTVSFLPSSAFNPPAKPSATHHQDSPGQDSPAAKSVPADPFPMAIFRVAACLFGFFMVVGWTLGGLTIYAGHCLARRKHLTFIQVMAGVNCLFIPYGTLLGVCTFLAVNTPEARAEFLLDPTPSR
jgi:hypothetical protein